MADVSSVENFVHILQKCRKQKHLVNAQRVHMHICINGLETHLALGNYLIPTFVECGSLSDAQQVFNTLVHRNEYSWTSLIQGYVECGKPQHALTLYQKMQDDCIHPSTHTFVALIKACTALKWGEKGRDVHTETARKAYERSRFVANTLVDMYAKCGSIAEAQEVFDNLPIRDVVTWTVLISGYVENGLGKEALKCFIQMQLESVPPSTITLVCSLRACGSIGAIVKGRELHAKFANDRYERELLVCNTLVDMYAKCGQLAEGRKVLREMSVRDVVSWNALISRYAEQGLGEEALDCFQQMQLECVSPNAVTFVCSLKACGSTKAVHKGREMLAEIAKESFDKDLFIGITSVDMFAKCGLQAEAWDMFDRLPVQNVVSWNALIAGYSECGLDEAVLACFCEMQLGGVSPNAVTFICSLKACGAIGLVDKAQGIHVEMVKEGYEKDSFVGSSLVDMYVKCGSLVQAREVLERLPVQSVVLWNALIAGFIDHGFGEEVLNCLEQMQQDGIPFNAITFISSLKACGSIGTLETGLELHAEIVKQGFDRDRFVGSALVHMYAKCGLLAEAQEVFEKWTVQDIVMWTALIAGYAEHGCIGEALNCFQWMRWEGASPDIVSWNALILGCAERGESEEAFECYVRMQEQGLSPNSTTFVSILKACGNTGASETGRRVHAEVSRAGFDTSEMILATALIDMYGKCGIMVDAFKMFEEMPARDLVTWNTLITGYAHQGESELVFQLFGKMREEAGIHPDEVTFLSVLTVCRNAGHVGKGLMYYEAMGEDYGIMPIIKHHNCTVDLLSRAGQFEQVVATLEQKSFEPDLVTWRTILGACRKLVDIELARHAFECAEKLDKKQAASFLFMCSTYADALL